MLRLAFAFLLALPVPASAQQFASYWANSGSLPPEYAWEVGVTISEDGQLVLKHCTGYETEGPACKTRRAKVSAAAMEAIRAAAIEAQLFGFPVRGTEDVPVGGGSRGGSVAQDGQVVSLPAWPVADDAERVGKVLDAIYAAIPTRLSTRFIDGN